MVDILGFTIGIPFQELIIAAAILALFLIVTRKIVKTVFNIIWISVASAAFPLVMRFLGFDFSIDINSSIFFVAVGLGLYVVYMAGKIVYVFLGIAEKAGKAVTYPLRSIKKQKEEKMKRKMEKLVKEKEEKERRKPD